MTASSPAYAQARAEGEADLARASFEVAERGEQLAPCPLVSRGRLTITLSPSAATGSAMGGGDAQGADTPLTGAGLAVHAGVGPAALLVSWAVSGQGDGAEVSEVPSAYVIEAYMIETSADSTDGRDGQWRREASIERNTANARTHVIEFDGQSWVRLLLGADHSSAPSFARFELHDASDGTDDCWLVLGDPALSGYAVLSGYAARAGSAEAPGEASWAGVIHERYPGYHPALIDATDPGASPARILTRLHALLETHPAARRVAIACSASSGAIACSASSGAMGDTSVEGISVVAGAANAPAPLDALDALIAAVRESGRLPVLARALAAPGRPRDAVDAFNRQVAALEAHHELAPGPDLAAWFDAHPDQLDPTGHPNLEGRKAIQRLWADALDVFYVPQ